MNPLVSITIGDVTLTDHGERVAIEIAEQQDRTFWSRPGASLAIGWLLGWLAREPGSMDALLGKTLAQLLEDLR